jgi:AAA ATPase domain
MKYNPFRPGGIVPPGIFCGRLEEIDAIEQSLLQTKHGNPQHFLLEGERGIGKSSLMLVAKVMATNKLRAKTDGFDFLVLEVELGDTTTYMELVRKIAGALRHQLRSRDHLKTLAAMSWEFLSKWNVLGIEYKRDSTELFISEVIDDLAKTLSDFLNEVGDSIDGILLLVDEADKPSPGLANLGEFTKTLTEKLTKQHCDRVCLGLAGLPVLVTKLKEGHESSLRVFETYMLEPLSDTESRDVVKRGLWEAQKKNGRETKITEAALDRIVHLSEGYPHFIQQFSFCAFAEDSDDIIDENDVAKGAYKENGALDQLGRKYFRELYFDKVSSGDYRRVLNVMADHLDSWVSRKEIIRLAAVKETQVSNALNALKSRNIILANEEKTGEYRLPTRSFAVWIKAINEKRAVINP